MKLKIEEIPVIMEGPGTVMRRQAGLGNMDIGYIELPKGADFTPLLKGLSNDNCCCPHWGYIFQGVFRIIYDDGNEDLLTEGDIFYLPGGHTAIVEEDLKCFMFSPDKMHGEVLDHAMKKMAEMSE
jgi:hypothetical protein